MKISLNIDRNHAGVLYVHILTSLTATAMLKYTQMDNCNLIPSNVSVFIIHMVGQTLRNRNIHYNITVLYHGKSNTNILVDD